VDKHKTSSIRFWVEPINGVEKSDRWTEQWVNYGWRLMEGLPGKLVAEYSKSEFSNPEAAARNGMEAAREGLPVLVKKTAAVGDGWVRKSLATDNEFSAIADEVQPSDRAAEALRALLSAVGATIITQQEHENGEVGDEEMSSTVDALEEALATYEHATEPD
jgi:hypothetical protein